MINERMTTDTFEIAQTLGELQADAKRLERFATTVNKNFANTAELKAALKKHGNTDLEWLLQTAELNFKMTMNYIAQTAFEKAEILRQKLNNDSPARKLQETLWDIDRVFDGE